MYTVYICWYYWRRIEIIFFFFIIRFQNKSNIDQKIVIIILMLIFIDFDFNYEIYGHWVKYEF